MALKPHELLINDQNWQQHVATGHIVNGQHFAKGLVPRDYKSHPQGFYAAAPPFSMPLIPQSEWSERIKDMEGNKSRLSDIRRTSGPNGGPIPSLDQNGKKYCWAHSTTMANILDRAVNNQPYVRLSAYAVACIIKNYADDGGWGAQSCDWIMANGIPSVDFWPEKSMSRSNDNPAMRANAALHKITAGFMDMNAAEYDRDLTFAQVMTCLLMRIPVVGDFNWWGHSICLMDPVEVTPGSFGVRFINSWTDSYGDMGEAVLSGTKAIPNGAVAPCVTTVSNS